MRKIRIFAYCIMDNHYHLILENSTGRMSDFFRALNGEYGKCYRKVIGDIGYVFQSRYKSTLIQNDSYLMTAIGYTILNPVRAGLVDDCFAYPWSSAKDYFSNTPSGIVDTAFVNELFGSKAELSAVLSSLAGKNLQLIQTKYGKILGERKFVDTALSRFDRRKRDYGDGKRRTTERFFAPVERIFMEFEEKIGQKVENLDVSTVFGKRLRNDLLVWLKEYGGLRYSEISEIPPFDELQFSSLAKLYRDAKRRRKRDSSTKS